MECEAEMAARHSALSAPHILNWWGVGERAAQCSVTASLALSARNATRRTGMSHTVASRGESYDGEVRGARLHAARAAAGDGSPRRAMRLDTTRVRF